MSVMLLTEQHFEFLSLKGGYTGSSESTLVKMPHCLKSHALAQYYMFFDFCHCRAEWNLTVTPENQYKKVMYFEMYQSFNP